MENNSRTVKLIPLVYPPISKQEELETLWKKEFDSKYPDINTLRVDSQGKSLVSPVLKKETEQNQMWPWITNISAKATVVDSNTLLDLNRICKAFGKGASYTPRPQEVIPNDIPNDEVKEWLEQYKKKKQAEREAKEAVEGKKRGKEKREKKGSYFLKWKLEDGVKGMVQIWSTGKIIARGFENEWNCYRAIYRCAQALQLIGAVKQLMVNDFNWELCVATYRLGKKVKLNEFNDEYPFDTVYDPDIGCRLGYIDPKTKKRTQIAANGSMTIWGAKTRAMAYEIFCRVYPLVMNFTSTECQDSLMMEQQENEAAEEEEEDSE